MNATDPHIFGPSDLAEHTGVSVDMQRDWRRRDVLPSEDMPGFCIRQSNGRWRFTIMGLYWVHSIARFSENGFDLVSGSTFTSEVIEASKAYWEHQMNGGQGVPPGFKRYLAIFPAEPDEEPIRVRNWTVREWKHDLISSLGDLASSSPVFVHIIDIISFADTWRKNLKLTEDQASRYAKLIDASSDEGRADG